MYFTKRSCCFLLAAMLTFLLPSALAAQTDDSEADTDSTEVTDTVVARAPSDSLPWPQNVRARLDRLTDNPMFHTSQLGLMVYDLTADSTLYASGEQQLLRPASTMKVITAIAAIDRLGGSYQFKTSLRYTGTIADRTLQGDLYCVGGFDPRFNSDDLRAFIESLRRMGVDTIRGRIIADKSMKSSDRYGEGWCWDDDNPTLSPLLISRKDVFVDRFISELKEAGIVVEAYNSEGETPAGAYEICTRSHTIDQILMRMLKESDNLYAESMFYQLAAAAGGDRPARESSARNYIRQLIRKAGADPSMCKIADGSGLSLYNYVSARIETMLLRYAWRNSNIYLHLYPALPVAGSDGTLRKRMRGTYAAGNVHAKTGTVTGISSLAGYLTAANGHVLCFSIINQGLLHGRNGRAFQDRVCRALCQP